GPDVVAFSANGTNAAKNATVTFTTPGTYTFLVTIKDPLGLSTTSSVTLNTTVTAPSITQQPTSQTVTTGQSATFSVTASGTGPLSYQWQKLVNGTWTNISGATSPAFTISSAQASNAGQYEVVVSNSAGSVTSNSVSLTVNAAVTAPTITSQPSSQT